MNLTCVHFKKVMHSSAGEQNGITTVMTRWQGASLSKALTTTTTAVRVENNQVRRRKLQIQWEPVVCATTDLAIRKRVTTTTTERAAQLIDLSS